MSDRNIGLEILEGIREIKAYKAGKIELKTREVTAPSSAKVIRSQMNLSQVDFAALMGVSPRTIQDWEQGRRQPKGAAKTLLPTLKGITQYLDRCNIAEQHPEEEAQRMRAGLKERRTLKRPQNGLFRAL